MNPILKKNKVIIKFSKVENSFKRPFSVVQSIVSGDLRIVPLIAIDFSLGNLTHGRDINLHKTDTKK